MIKYIIFDFDGTIANTISQVFEVVNQMAVKYGYQQVKKGEIGSWRGKSSHQIVNELKVPKLKLPLYLLELFRELNKSIDEIKLFPGVKELVLKLKERGYKLGLLSSNSAENIEKFLERNSLSVFDFIDPGIALFGKDKKLKKILHETRANKDELLYVGDENRDIEAAKKVGIKIVAVTWGYQTKELLQKYHPDYITDKPSDFLKILNE